MAPNCRLCISSSSNLTSIYRSRNGYLIVDMIKIIIPIPIERAEKNLSQKICEECLSIIVSAVNLRMISVENDFKQRAEISGMEDPLNFNLNCKQELGQETKLRKRKREADGPSNFEGSCNWMEDEYDNYKDLNKDDASESDEEDSKCQSNSGSFTTLHKKTKARAKVILKRPLLDHRRSEVNPEDCYESSPTSISSSQFKSIPSSGMSQEEMWLTIVKRHITATVYSPYITILEVFLEAKKFRYRCKVCAKTCMGFTGTTSHIRRHLKTHDVEIREESISLLYRESRELLGDRTKESSKESADHGESDFIIAEEVTEENIDTDQK